MSRFDSVSRTESRAGSTISRNASLVSIELLDQGDGGAAFTCPRENVVERVTDAGACRRRHRTRAALIVQIKKNTAPHELKPSDILIERFTAWKQIVKMLIGALRPPPWSLSIELQR